MTMCLNLGLISTLGFELSCAVASSTAVAFGRGLVMPSENISDMSRTKTTSNARVRFPNSFNSTTYLGFTCIEGWQVNIPWLLCRESDLPYFDQSLLIIFPKLVLQ